MLITYLVVAALFASIGLGLALYNKKVKSVSVPRAVIAGLAWPIVLPAVVMAIFFHFCFRLD